MAAQDMRQHHVDALADQLPGRPWKRLSAGQGVKGERLYDWALMPWAESEGWEHALLVRRSLEAEPEYAFHFTYAGQKQSRLKTLVAVAGQRWAIESAFQMAKPAPPRTGLCPWGGKVSANWIISKSGTGRAGIGTSPSTPATKTCRRGPRSVHAGSGRSGGAARQGEKNFPSRRFHSAYRKSDICSLPCCAAAGTVWNIFCTGLTGEDITHSWHASSTFESNSFYSLPLVTTVELTQ